jgi:hypothetical protein
MLELSVTASLLCLVQFTQLRRTSSDDDASISPPLSPSVAQSKAADDEDKPLKYGHFKWGNNGEGWACNSDEDCELLVSH